MRVFEKNAFRYSGLRSIRIPKTVEIFGEQCFFCCENLTEVLFEIGSNLKKIEKHAFEGTSVAAIEIPAQCQELAGGALCSVQSVTVSTENPFFVTVNKRLMP
jgi:hypothetical protein